MTPPDGRHQRWSRRGRHDAPPPWWPTNEPFEGRIRTELFAVRRRKRFVGALGAIFALLLILSATGAATLIALLFRHSPLFGFPTPTALLILVVTFGVAAMLVFVRGMRGVGAPIGDIIAAADRVATGDYAVRVDERGPRYIRVVARAFNRMTKQLASQDQQRRHLMADIAHELRTPLTIIQGRLEGLLDGVYARDDEQLTEVVEETRMLARLVEDLRTLANAEAGSLSLHKEPTDLAVLIHDAAASFATDVRAKSIALRIDERGELPIVDVDPLRIREVLTNLLANAIRHTNDGGAITITIAIAVAAVVVARTVDDRSGETIVVSVSDTGAGISADDLPKIFDRFYKGHTSHGSGLGLTIARNLVVAHGGEIRAESAAGQGTTITFTLPVAPRA
jgi:two-component system OmpR family sensor kinase/two-component system sensor histidine kinase BaeS